MLIKSATCVAKLRKPILRSRVYVFVLCYMSCSVRLDVVERSMLETVLDWHTVIPVSFQDLDEEIVIDAERIFSTLRLTSDDSSLKTRRWSFFFSNIVGDRASFHGTVQQRRSGRDLHRERRCVRCRESYRYSHSLFFVRWREATNLHWRQICLSSYAGLHFMDSVSLLVKIRSYSSRSMGIGRRADISWDSFKDQWNLFIEKKNKAEDFTDERNN